MPARARRPTVPSALGVLAFAFALAQRPGWSSSDTKVDLHVDPVRFLGDIASLWTPSSGLGGVESAQYAGYLFPMGPFFALAHVLGVSDWLADRLWLGTLLAVGCWGMVRLAERLGAATSSVGALAAGLVYLLNPYVVVFTNRTSITLLAYALLPWLVLVAHRGLREPRRWRLAALFALLVTAGGGGVNAAVVALVLLGPAALVLYEPLTGAVAWRDAWAFCWRSLAAIVAASLWWVAPAAAQAGYGVDFLRFTEPAGAIWATTSLSESFRVMGYWISYIGVGFHGVVRPYFSDSGTLLFDDLVVAATFLVPGLALLGFAWTRTRRYAAYFLLLVLAGTLIMAIGFPEGTPLRKGATYAYNHFAGVRFLRTTYKAGPLVVLGVAGLGAMAAELAAARLAARARRAPVVAAGLAACAIAALAAWPLVSGKAVDPQVTWKHVPAAWQGAAAALDRSLGDNSRAIVLPGQLYAFYRWGGTIDPILPSLTSKPVAVRNAVPYGDLRGTDLLWTTDALVQQDRLLPGQLPDLLRVMSVRTVVTATDDDVFRSGASEPAAVAASLADQRLGAPTPYGRSRRFAAPRGRLGSGAVLPDVRTYRMPDALPLVRVEPRAPLAVVDGSAQGLADLAGERARPVREPFALAGDLKPDAIRAAARSGGAVVITDSNRRRIFVVSRMRQNTGATLGPADPISEDAATLDPFPERGAQAQTVAVFHGAASIRSPFSPGYSQFPEHRPFAAFDGDPRTAWLPDPALVPLRHWVEIAFARPRDVPSISVLPRAEAGARPVAVAVNGRRFALGTGWTQLPLGLKQARSLRLLVVSTRTGSAAAGGLAEVRIPRLHVTESLRPPVLAEQALRGTDLSRSSLTYSFSRAGGDDPWRRTRSAGVHVRERVTDSARLEQMRVDGAGDEEVGIDRVIAPPAARSYGVRAWLSITPEAADSAIDRLVGAGGRIRADGSGRFEGRPGFRASSALDGDPATAWVAPWQPGEPAWLKLSAPRALALRELRLTPGPAGVRVPATVRVEWPGGGTGPLPVTAGRVRLPRAVRTREFTLRVVSAGPGRVAAVGIGELTAPGLGRIPVRRSGVLPRPCGAVVVLSAGRPLQLRAEGGVRQLDAGRPLRATGCGRLALPAGSQRVRAPAATLRPDRLLLTSPAPDPIARISTIAGDLRDPGDPGRGKRDGVNLDVRAPAWLVLGESYDRGWRAWCGGKALGEPLPLDGYANAWPVEPGCESARFAFAPQGPVHLIQLLSAFACLVLLVIALAPRRRRRATATAAATGDWPDQPPARLPVRTAAIAGLIAGGALAFCFSLRSGVLIAPATALVLWRGIPAKPLALAGGALLAIAVPLVYIAFPADDLGGFNPSYAGDNAGAHWVAVAVWVLLALALWRVLSTASRGAARARRSAP